MNKFVLGIVLLIALGFFVLSSFDKNKQTKEEKKENMEYTILDEIKITPISHATMVLDWHDKTIYTDPVGKIGDFSSSTPPDVILVTDIHGDHLNVETLFSLAKPETVVVVPDEVAKKINKKLPGTLVVLKNGEKTNQHGFTIEAVPMYNVPEKVDAFHTKGRGNGYIIELSGRRVYVSGDTSNIPEMKNFKNIDLAFLSMNLPYTMDIEEAAEATIAINPKMIVPYHYRGSDTQKFKEIVNSRDPKIIVNLINFYP
jgi:L-ascorbate metabolism protein UlaG (beta-lactamase superfamily)